MKVLKKLVLSFLCLAFVGFILPTSVYAVDSIYIDRVDVKVKEPKVGENFGTWLEFSLNQADIAILDANGNKLDIPYSQSRKPGYWINFEEIETSFGYDVSHSLKEGDTISVSMSFHVNTNDWQYHLDGDTSVYINGRDVTGGASWGPVDNNWVSAHPYFKVKGEGPAPQKAKQHKDVKQDEIVIDYDTYKSDVASHTVLCGLGEDFAELMDMKVHATDSKNAANQELLAKLLTNGTIIKTFDVFPRRDLSLNENGAKRTLTINDVKDVSAGNVYLVVYNTTDGAYLLQGNCDGKGTASFAGFILRPASTITLVK